MLIITVGFAFVSAVFYNFFATPTFTSTAIISFEDVISNKMTGTGFESYDHEALFVSNRIKELQTHSFAGKIYDELPVESRAAFVIENAGNQDFIKAKIVKKIKAGLNVTPTPSSPNMILISFSSPSQQIAMDVPNAAVRALEKSNLSTVQAGFSSLKSFIDEQIEIVEKDLQQAEVALRQFKVHSGITSLDNDSKELLKRITEVEVLYNNVYTKIGAAEKKLAVIDQEIEKYRANADSSLAQASSPMLEKMRAQLTDLQAQYTTLVLQDYSENHSKVRELIDRIDQLKGNLVAKTREMVDGKNLNGVIDPISQLQKYLNESIALRIELESLKVQEQLLTKTNLAYKRKLRGLSANGTELFQLERTRDVHNKNYLRLLDEREQARIREASQFGAFRIIESAAYPDEPSSPRKFLNLVVALFLGTSVGLMAIFVRNALSQGYRSPDSVEKLLGREVFVSIPRKKKTVFSTVNKKNDLNEMIEDLRSDLAYRNANNYLWTYLQALNKKSVHSVVVTSSLPGEGKSTVATSLAVTAAKLGIKTLLIDGDFYKPTLHQILGCTQIPGMMDFVNDVIEKDLTDLLIEQIAISKGIPKEEIAGYADYASSRNNAFPQGDQRKFTFDRPIVQKTRLKNLKLLTLGAPKMEPGFFWTSPILKIVMEYLSQKEGFIIIDSPPLLEIPDAINIAGHVDACLLCVEAEQTNEQALRRTKKIIEQINNKSIGVVFNKAEPADIYGYGQRSKYYSAIEKQFNISRN